MPDEYAVAVVGATSLVGEEIVRLLGDRGLPVAEIRALGSARTAGRRLEDLPIGLVGPDAFRDVVDMACENAGLFREESVKFGKVRPGDVPMVVTQLDVQHMLVGKHLGQYGNRSMQPRVCDSYLRGDRYR